MKKAFIYKIQNLENGKMYIGSSTTPRSRWNQHTSQLKKNKHHSTYLQNSWNKYGAEMFEFVIIDECKVEIQFTREREWVIKEQSHLEEWGYNMCIPEVGGGYTHTEHHKQIKREKSTINAARQWKEMRESGKFQIIVIDLITEEKEYFPLLTDCPYNLKNKKFNFEQKKFRTSTYNKTEEQIQEEFKAMQLKYQNYLKSQTKTTPPKQPKKYVDNCKFEFKSNFETLIFNSAQEAAEYFNIGIPYVQDLSKSGKFTKIMFYLINNNGIINEAPTVKQLALQNNHNYKAYKKLMEGRYKTYLGYIIHRNDTLFEVQRLS